MAVTREFSSSMSTPQSGSASLDLIVNGSTHHYNPFGEDMTVTIPLNGMSVFIDAPVELDNVSVTQHDEGSAGQAKYLRCMELLGDGQLPVCTTRQKGPAGTHGAFGPLAYITDSCELCFYIPVYPEITSGGKLFKLTSAGVWSKVT